LVTGKENYDEQEKRKYVKLTYRIVSYVTSRDRAIDGLEPSPVTGRRRPIGWLCTDDFDESAGLFANCRILNLHRQIPSRRLTRDENVRLRNVGIAFYTEL